MNQRWRTVRHYSGLRLRLSFCVDCPALPCHWLTQAVSSGSGFRLRATQTRPNLRERLRKSGQTLKIGEESSGLTAGIESAIQDSLYTSTRDLFFECY